MRYIFTSNENLRQRDWLSAFEISSYFKILWDFHVVFSFIHGCHNLHNLIYLKNKVMFKLKYLVFTENRQWSPEVYYVPVNGLSAYTHSNYVRWFILWMWNRHREFKKLDQNDIVKKLHNCSQTYSLPNIIFYVQACTYIAKYIYVEV